MGNQSEDRVVRVPGEGVPSTGDLKDALAPGDAVDEDSCGGSVPICWFRMFLSAKATKLYFIILKQSWILRLVTKINTFTTQTHTHRPLMDWYRVWLFAAYFKLQSSPEVDAGTYPTLVYCQHPSCLFFSMAQDSVVQTEVLPQQFLVWKAQLKELSS